MNDRSETHWLDDEEGETPEVLKRALDLLRANEALMAKLGLGRPPQTERMSRGSLS